jgi:hypothetical protein
VEDSGLKDGLEKVHIHRRRNSGRGRRRVVGATKRKTAQK